MGNIKVLVINSALIISAVYLSACKSTQVSMNSKKVIIDNSFEGKNQPEWVASGKLSWEKDGITFFKSQFTIRGDQRLNACYDLAKSDLKASVLSEISSEIQGQINSATTGLAESNQIQFNKSFTEQFSGQLRGLKISEQHFERYIILDRESINCFVLAEIKNSDFSVLRQRIVDSLIQENSEVVEALKTKQLHFFSK